MSSILLLPEHVVNQIAAGEVIENPACVVKELVENALDAGANNIIVEIKGGGLLYIAVHDDGHGMSPEDALMSLQRHATSKIASFDDLSRLMTMGFRGEALASIAAVSKMKITSAGEGRAAVCIAVEGGVIQPSETASRRRGTSIEVRHLFYNVPVRKKFQKSVNASIAAISRIVEQLSLAYPHKNFTLISHEKTVLQTKSVTMEERVREILGPDFLAKTVSVDYRAEGLELQGFVGLPQNTRFTRLGQHLFVNKRKVFSPFVSQAIKEAYGTRIAEDAHPVFLFFLNTRPDLIDVNVHPQKKEIRFSDQSFFWRHIKTAVEQLFLPQDSLLPDLSFTQETVETPYRPLYGPTAQLPESAQLEFLAEPCAAHDVLGGVLGGYYLVSDFQKMRRFNFEEGLMLLDLNAGRARIFYDNLSHKMPASETLLTPQIVEVSIDDARFVEGFAAALLEFGFEARAIGKTTVALDAMPLYAEAEDFLALLLDLQEEKQGNAWKMAFLRKSARKIAQRIKEKNKHYTRGEAEAILERLLHIEERLYDPLGSPIAIHLKVKDLASLFRKR